MANNWKVLSTSTTYSTYNLAAEAAAELTLPQTVVLLDNTTQDEDINILINGVNIDLGGYTLTMTTDNTMVGFTDNNIAYVGKITNGNIIKTATNGTNPVISLLSIDSVVDFSGTIITTSGTNTYGVVSYSTISNLNVSAGYIGLAQYGKTITNIKAFGSLYGINAIGTTLIRCSLNDAGETCGSLFHLNTCVVNYCDAISTSTTTGQCFSNEGISYFSYCTGSSLSTGIGNPVFAGSGSDYYNSCSAESPNSPGFFGCGTLNDCDSFSFSYITMYNCKKSYRSTFVGGSPIAAIDADGIAIKLQNCIVKNINDYYGANAIYLTANGSSFEICTISVANADASCITGNAAYTAHFEDAGNVFIGSNNPVTNIVNV